jgi:P4 family phage/plasmid primase-like protien
MEIQIETSEIFFTELAINIGHDYFASLFWNLAKHDYIFSLKLGWFGYNLHNKLIRYGKQAPINMLNDIIAKLKALVKSKYEKLDVNNKDFLNHCKTFKKAYNLLGNTKYCDSIITLLKDFYNIEDFEKILDKNNYLIPFEDCVFDVKKAKFRNIKKKDFISITTGYFIKNEIALDGQILDNEKYVKKGWMKDELLDLEYIDEFLDSIFSPELKKYMVDLLSLNLIHNNFEKLFIWVGSGGNGKGVLSTLLNRSMGNLYYQADSQFLTTKYKGQTANSTLYNCQSKRFVMVSEPEMGEGQNELKFNIEFVKKITGKDDITCRALNENNITFTPSFNLICQTNEKPILSGVDEAIKRRIVIIPFNYTFVDNPKYNYQKQRDNTLKDKLSSEKYYISFMFYLIKNLVNILENLSFNMEKLEKLNVELPEEVNNEIEAYINENDIIGKFIDEKIKITDDKNDNISKTELYKLFLQFISENKYDKVSKDKFYNNLKSKGLCEERYSHNNKTIRGYRNIKYIDDDDESDGDI